MDIAVLGWGSLIWRPGHLRTKTRWRRDGPKLPIEFARISDDQRLTLVIHPGSEDQPTYWALSEFTVLDEACQNLRERENARLADIHYLTRNGKAAKGIPPQVMERVTDWLERHEELQAVIWTGLPSNWNKKRKRDFTLDDAVEYLRELETSKDQATYNRAREYITKAPPHIQTAVRRAMRAQGWEDVEVPTILFES